MKRHLSSSFRAWRYHSTVLAVALLASAVGTTTAAAQAVTTVQSEKISAELASLASELETGDSFGTSMVDIGDVDGDGSRELAVGTQGDDDAVSNGGAVWILSVDHTNQLVAQEKISSTAGNFDELLNIDDGFGRSVAWLGTLGGPTALENVLTVGAAARDQGGLDRGSVFVLQLDPVTADVIQPEIEIAHGLGGFSGSLVNAERFGNGMAAVGDIDGDGVQDLAVGAPGHPGGGAIWMLFLNSDSTVKDHELISSTEGGLSAISGCAISGGEEFGNAVANIGDVDEDGVSDLAVGALGDSAVYVLLLNDIAGGGSPLVKDCERIPNPDGNPSDEFGHSVSGVGDLDGDGIVDIAVGAQEDEDGGFIRGAVWLFYLNNDGSVDVAQKLSDDGDGLFPDGELDDNDNFATALEVLRDPSTGERNGLIVSAIGDDDGVVNSGAVYLVTFCGDGKATGAEECDDGNTDPGDGCDASCHVEKSFCCDGLTTSCNDDTACGGGTCCVSRCDTGTLAPICDSAGTVCDTNVDCGAAECCPTGGPCGNGIVEATEACDLGTSNCDPLAGGACCASHCDETTCQVLGECTNDQSCCSDASECAPGFGCCGNGIIDVGETCDDGNLQDGDCCTSSCLLPAGCTPPCPRVAGPQLLQAASMKAKFSDKDGDGTYERWKIGRKGANGDFNLDPGQHTDCRQEQMEITFIENNGNDLPRELGSFILNPGVFQIDASPTKGRIKPTLEDDPSLQIDERCKLTDKGELNSTPPGLAKAQWQEKGVKVKYRYQGKLLGQIQQPTSFTPPGTASDSNGKIRACVRVGGSAGHSELSCTLRKNGAQLKCQSD